MFSSSSRVLKVGWVGVLLSVVGLVVGEGLIEIAFIISRPWYWQNALGFLTVLMVVAYHVFGHRAVTLTISQKQFVQVSLGLIFGIGLYLANLFTLNFSLVSPILSIMCIFLALGLMTHQEVWWRLRWLVVLLILALPFLERVQRFISFPFRLFTAEIVSFLLDWFNIAHLSQATVILAENSLTSIDVPCSGITSIYTGSIFLVAWFFLQRIPVTWKTALLSLAFYASLLFFNVWRVFSLTYIYGIAELTAAGDMLHVGIGLVGFVVSCGLLMKLSQPLSRQVVTMEGPKLQAPVSFQFRILLLLVLVMLVPLKHLGLQYLEQEPSATEQSMEFVPQHLLLEEEPLSQVESNYFSTPEVVLSRKYRGQTQSGAKYSLLLVGSSSARSHHDPETCLQAIGHSITDSTLLPVDSFLVRHLSLNDTQDHVYYWFVGEDKVILDYSERVWQQLVNPGQVWILVQVGVAEDATLTVDDRNELLRIVNQEVKALLVGSE